tara:strand:+ start:1069 stop:1752 length:684 start_codon:yes stop_codon:yes gene_type:complete
MANYGEDSMYDVEMGQNLQNNSYSSGNMPTYERSGPPQAIDPIMPSSEMQGSQTWFPQQQFVDPSTFPQIPQMPEADYSLAEQLLHAGKTGATNMASKAKDKSNQISQAVAGWWSRNKPQFTKTSKGFLPDGSPAYSPEGQQITREEVMRFQNPMTARKIGPTEEFGGFNPLERAFGVDVGFQSPMVGTGQMNYPQGGSPGFDEFTQLMDQGYSMDEVREMYSMPTE